MKDSVPFVGDAALRFREAWMRHEGACEVGTLLDTVTHRLLPHTSPQVAVATMVV